MALRRPLSRRDDPTYDEPCEGLPDHLFHPVWEWVQGTLGTDSTNRRLRLQALQLHLRMDPALDWGDGLRSAVSSLYARMLADRELALDVLDNFLSREWGWQRGRVLETLLYAGGSAWTAQESADGRNGGLERRAPAPVAEAMAPLASDSQRAHDHLRRSWTALMGRGPDPSTAYREAVRAVEAAAKPVVSPANALTTLGTVIRDMRARPEKWDVGLEHGTSDQVITMCALLWKGQVDRHGSDDPAAPLNVSQKEADSAFYVALTLVRLFTSGAIARA